MQRLKSTHNNVRVLRNLGLSKLISDLDNNELIKLPNLEEVKVQISLRTTRNHQE